MNDPEFLSPISARPFVRSFVVILYLFLSYLHPTPFDNTYIVKKGQN